MRTINILNAGSTNDYHQGDIVNISGSTKEFSGRFVVNKIAFMKIIGMFAITTLSEFASDNTKTNNKPKKYKSAFIKSHKKVW